MIPPTTRSRARQRGATRMDILLGVGVLALLFSVAGVPGSKGDERVLEIAESRIRTAVDLASGMARSTGVPHGVAFDVEGERLAVIDVQGEVVQDPLTGHEGVVALGQGKLQDAVDVVHARFGPGRTVAVFGQDGLPLSGGNVLLVSGETERKLVLDAQTGFVDRRLTDGQEP